LALIYQYYLDQGLDRAGMEVHPDTRKPRTFPYFDSDGSILF